VPRLNKNGHGDMLVTVYVVTPTKLTAEQRELLQKLGKTLGKEPIPQAEKGFIDKLKDAFSS
jgi:molecular chaperone DnaJ